VLNQEPRYEGVLGEWKYSSAHSLTSEIDGGEWSALRPCRFTPRTHWVEGWVGPRAGLDMVSKRKIPSPRQESNPDHAIVQPVSFNANYYIATKGARKIVPVILLWV